VSIAPQEANRSFATATVDGMARMLRSDLPDGLYHVTARGVAGTAIYHDDADRRDFLRLLAEGVERAPWTCLAFCLMTTHYHVVLQTTRRAMSKEIQRLNGVYAQRFNRRHGREGHVFYRRFASWLIEDDDHLANTCAYVLENPVRAGLCATAGAWPWSAVAPSDRRLDERTFDG
jgi:REP element-mobilizing transposase RayT